MRRLIVFLQQSSVEWASSLWLHVVQEVDPQFQRTVSAAPHPTPALHCTETQLHAAVPRR
jgi:hypothetical protein